MKMQYKYFDGDELLLTVKTLGSSDMVNHLHKILFSEFRDHEQTISEQKVVKNWVVVEDTRRK